MTVALVLGSASPARLRLLHAAGVQPRVFGSGVDEDEVTAQARAANPDIEPRHIALVLARAKAKAVSSALSGRSDHLVLGCDSVLEFEGAVHGKPVDAAQARARWERMRGRSGTLHTGHWVIDDRSDGSHGVGAVASTVVHFARISDEEIDAYIATGEPLRVAGGFTIDGLGAPYISSIEGDHTNVVGLSLPLLRELLADMGVAWHDICEPPAPA